MGTSHMYRSRHMHDNIIMHYECILLYVQSTYKEAPPMYVTIYVWPEATQTYGNDNFIAVYCPFFLCVCVHVGNPAAC